MIPDKSLDPDDKYTKTVTNLVEHPIQLKPPDEPLQPQYLKVILLDFFPSFTNCSTVCHIFSIYLFNYLEEVESRRTTYHREHQ